MYNFKNCILLVVFNYSNCVCNKNIIKEIYEKHFKKIIFYSDYPIIQDDEVNFIEINSGAYTHKIFNEFYKKYKLIIDDSDGLFYTMDDNIINVNILNLFDNEKIIYYYNEIKSLNNYSGWHWDNNWGKNAINKLIENDEFKKYNIDKFSGGFSDWFYLPKKYLTDKLFDLFELFSNYNVFLELALPSIINNIELDKSKYQIFSCHVLWGIYREKLLNKNYIYTLLNQHHCLIVHPIKFNDNPDSKEWLKEIFCKDKCVIITTINKPTETILKHIENKEYDVIIIGDNKTPDDYKNLNCIYLDIPSQKKLFPELSELLPYNHYCRKNLGYLYAIKKGYKIIYETDDDNIPYDNFDSILQYNNVQMITEQNSVWINIFKYYTNNAHIWPRGLPLSLLKKDPNYLIQDTDKTPSIINGLVENDPDVDALFRIICNHQDSIQWDKNKCVLIDNKNVCIFNTQNTFWLNPELFICLLIPSTVSFRYCDILRGIINNIILNKTNNYMMYSSPNVIQNRNEHNLIEDFKSEYEMYIHNENILNFIDNKRFLYLIQSESGLPEIYNCLKSRDYILLSYIENSPDTTIFFPESTSWATSRNKAREYVLNMKLNYDYYIYLDKDVIFTNDSQEKGFNKFEELLTKYKPYIANPNHVGYYNPYILPGDDEVQTVIQFDGFCNAFSHKAFLSNKLFPFIDIFDNRSWYMSQYIMILLCSFYKNDVILFRNLHIRNESSSEYPQEFNEKICEEAAIITVNKIKEDNDKNINLNWTDLDWKFFNDYSIKSKLKVVNSTNIKPDIKPILLSIYNNLLVNNVITQKDINILNKWNTYF